MIEQGGLRLNLALIVLPLAAGFASIPTASAATYESEPVFCDGAVVRDFLAPLDRRAPPIPAPPPDGRLDFGPGSVTMKSLPRLLVGGGRVGYKLFLRRGAPTAHPRWRVAATLSRVHFLPGSTLFWGQADIDRPVVTISRKRDAAITFEVPSEPAFYRVTTSFQSSSGRGLGYYHFNFRVVAPTRDVRLGLNADSYRSESTVFGRVENFGTEPATFGAPYAIERLEGSRWIEAPESPGAFVKPLYRVGAGRTGQCDGFWIPPAMPPGRYRMSKGVRSGNRGFTRTAEFDIVP